MISGFCISWHGTHFLCFNAQGLWTLCLKYLTGDPSLFTFIFIGSGVYCRLSPLSIKTILWLTLVTFMICCWMIFKLFLIFCIQITCQNFNKTGKVFLIHSFIIIWFHCRVRKLLTSRSLSVAVSVLQVQLCTLTEIQPATAQLELHNQIITKQN